MTTAEIDELERALLSGLRELYDTARRSPLASETDEARRHHNDAVSCVRSLAISARVVVSGETTVDSLRESVRAEYQARRSDK